MRCNAVLFNVSDSSFAIVIDWLLKSVVKLH